MSPGYSARRTAGVTEEVEARIRGVFADAGCTGRLHARRCDRSRTGTAPDAAISVGGHERVVLASVYKLPLLLAFCTLVDRGIVDPIGEVRVDPSECTPGPTGLSVLNDPVTLSWRDLATSMMTVSDNAAADVLLGEIGHGAVDDVLGRLGLSSTRIVGGTADLQRSLVEDTDSHTTAEAFAALANNDEAWTVSAYDPAYTSASTPEEMTRLLHAVWAGSVLSDEQTRFVQKVMRTQIWPHRIAAAFPHRNVSVAGKTGTIGVIRNEVAMVEFPGEYPVAVAVFTRAARADPALPVVDAAIGEAARVAVTALRRPLPGS